MINHKRLMKLIIVMFVSFMSIAPSGRAADKSNVVYEGTHSFSECLERGGCYDVANWGPCGSHNSPYSEQAAYEKAMHHIEFTLLKKANVAAEVKNIKKCHHGCKAWFDQDQNASGEWKYVGDGIFEAPPGNYRLNILSDGYMGCGIPYKQMSFCPSSCTVKLNVYPVDASVEPKDAVGDLYKICPNGKKIDISNGDKPCKDGANQETDTGDMCPETPGTAELCGCPNTGVVPGDVIFRYAKPAWGSWYAGYAEVEGQKYNFGHVAVYAGNFQAKRTYQVRHANGVDVQRLNPNTQAWDTIHLSKGDAIQANDIVNNAVIEADMGYGGVGISNLSNFESDHNGTAGNIAGGTMYGQPPGGLNCRQRKLILERMAQFAADTDDRKFKYHILSNNCAQTVAQAYTEAGLNAWQPFVSATDTWTPNFVASWMLLSHFGESRPGVNPSATPESRVSIVVKSPADLHVYDSTGRHTGATTNGIETNIPYSEYWVLENGHKVLNLLAQADDTYSIVVNGYAEGTVELEIAAYNFFTIEQAQDIHYKPIVFTSQTSAKITLDPNLPPEASNFTMAIDQDSDGQIDQYETPTITITDNDEGEGITDSPQTFGKNTSTCVTKSENLRLMSVADAYVYAYSYRNWNRSNRGKYDQLRAGWHPTGGESRAYIKFDLAGVDPASAKRAVLRLYHFQTAGNNGIDLGIYRVTGPWNEGADTYHSSRVEKTAPTGDISWIQQPTVDPTPVATFNPGNKMRDWTEVVISSLVKQWLSGTPNYGLVIKPVGHLARNVGASTYHFASRERDVNLDEPKGENKAPALILSATNLIGNQNKVNIDTKPSVSSSNIHYGQVDTNGEITTFTQIMPLPFFDNFSSGLRNWDTQNIQPKLVGGKLYWNEPEHRPLLTKQSIPFENVIIEFDAWCEKDGLPVRWENDQGQGYLVALGAWGNTRSLSGFGPGNVENVYGNHITFKVWHHYRIVRQGDLLEASIDNHPVISRQIPTRFKGNGTLRFHSYSKVGIDNVHIYRAVNYHNTSSTLLTPPIPPSDISGTWHWFDGGTVRIYKNGTIRSSHGSPATWTIKRNGSKYIYTINWNDGQYIDTLTLHGDTLDGRNRGGTHVWGKRISKQASFSNHLVSGTYRVQQGQWQSTWKLRVTNGQITGTSEWTCCPGHRVDKILGAVVGNSVVIERDCSGQGYNGQCKQIYRGQIKNGHIEGTCTGTGLHPGDTWVLDLN